jgi:preprotein translocase SecE subunit
MEQSLQKWVSLSYLIVSFILSYLAHAGFEYLSQVFDLETKVSQLDLITRGSSIALGLICFLVLQTHRRATKFMTEVMEELQKVTWPTQTETVSATWVVLIVIVIAGMTLGFLDYCWTQLIKLVL